MQVLLAPNALTVSIGVRVATKGEEGVQNNLGGRHACKVCARSAVLRRRAARSMRDCRTRKRQSLDLRAIMTHRWM
eukprot:2982338-Pleurochrysis_carterae.AAC.3